MAVLNPEDIVATGGNVEDALDAKRRVAAQHLKETGSLPDWWELGVSLGSTQFAARKGPPKKFADADAFFAQGLAFFQKCAENDVLPTQSALILFMGFTGNSQYHGYVRRNGEFREAHDRMQTMLHCPLEMAISGPGSQVGTMFLLKNTPEGFSPTDPSNKPLSFPWRDKQTTELTGPDGGPIEIKRDEDPQEAYMKMLNGGILEDKEGEGEALKGEVEKEMDRLDKENETAVDRELGERSS